MKTVVGLFDDFSMAQHVVKDLQDAGFRREDISLIANDATNQYATYKESTPVDDDVTPGEGASFGAVVGALTGALAALGSLVIPGVGLAIVAGPIIGALTGAVAGGVTGGVVAALIDSGVSKEEAPYYAEGVRRGGTLITVQAADADASRARDILSRHSAVNIKERSTNWKESGWAGYDAKAKPYSAAEVNKFRQQYSPNPSMSGSSMGNRGTASNMGSSNRLMMPVSGTGDWNKNYSQYDADFRKHYNQNYNNSGYNYDDFQPVYQYGYYLATTPDYSGDWNTFEQRARTQWEARNPNTWDRFKDAVRYAWDRVRGKDTASTYR
jgi:hypothetical protein